MHLLDNCPELLVLTAKAARPQGCKRAKTGSRRDLRWIPYSIDSNNNHVEGRSASTLNYRYDTLELAAYPAVVRAFYPAIRLSSEDDGGRVCSNTCPDWKEKFNDCSIR